MTRLSTRRQATAFLPWLLSLSTLLAPDLVAAQGAVVISGPPPGQGPNVISTDSDGDGLSDDLESINGTDPFDPDTDDDSLSDGDEVLVYLTSPLSPTIGMMLDGSITARAGVVSQTYRVPEILFLSADRTYVFGVRSQGPGDQGMPEMGAWYRDRDRLLLYQQNLFESVVALEADLETDAGFPVEVVLRGVKRTGSSKARSALLSLQGSATFTFLAAGYPPLGASITDRGSGPLAPIPIPAPSQPQAAAGAVSPNDGEPAGSAPSAPLRSALSRFVAGTVTMRLGHTIETRAVNGTIFLNADRTFRLDLGTGEVAHEGMWFMDRSRILLYPENLLDQTLAIEQEIAMQFGEPARLELLAVRDAGKIDSLTGAIQLTLDRRQSATLPDSGVVIPVRTTWQLTQTPAP